MKLNQDSNTIIGVSPKSTFFSKFVKHKKHLAIFGIVLLLLCLTVAGYAYYQKKNTAVQVGQVRITKAQYENLIKQAKNSKVNETEAKAIIVKAAKTENAAIVAGISVSVEEVNKATQANFVQNTNQTNNWEKLQGKTAAIENKLIQLNAGGYSAYVFTFPFSRYFMYTMAGKPTDPNLYNRNAIASDKNYAQSKATEYLGKLRAGQLSSDAAVTALKADSRLVYGSSANDSKQLRVNMNGTQPINGTSYTQLVNKDIFDTIKTTQKGNFSEIKTKKILATPGPLAEYSNKSVDSAYYFVYVGDIVQPNPKVKEFYDKTFTSTKVVINV